MKSYTKPIQLQEFKPRRRADSSLALINVVFLLLLFLLVSGTLRPPLPEGFDWAETVKDTGSGNLQGSLVLDKDGALWFEGDQLDTTALLDFLATAAKSNPHLVVQVDKRSKMDAVSALTAQLKASGIRRVSLMTIEAGRR